MHVLCFLLQSEILIISFENLWKIMRDLITLYILLLIHFSLFLKFGLLLFELYNKRAKKKLPSPELHPKCSERAKSAWSQNFAQFFQWHKWWSLICSLPRFAEQTAKNLDLLKHDACIPLLSHLVISAVPQHPSC